MKIGILGGGQLGRMFLQNAINYPAVFYVLDPDSTCPSKDFCQHFVQGDFNEYETVYQFGKLVDILTIEIEHVNIDALETLENEGLNVIPSTKTLRTIQDKGLQKEFFSENNIPTSPYKLVNTKADLKSEKFPLVQKFRKGGYDGKGVKIINSSSEFEEVPSVIEEMVEIEKELAVIIVKSELELKIYPVVEMVFDTKLHLVDELFSPANISEELTKKAQEISLKAVEAFESEGIFAVELFLTKTNEILVNEIAPRVHNSGHHTIEANYSSQYDSLIRVLLNMPLGNIETREMATMINLIGEQDHKGNVKYEGLEDVLKIPKLYFHDYGKKETRPGRKMGHITILGERTPQRQKEIQFIKEKLKVISL